MLGIPSFSRLFLLIKPHHPLINAAHQLNPQIRPKLAHLVVVLRSTTLQISFDTLQSSYHRLFCILVVDHPAEKGVELLLLDK